jgi:hypothetical protein
MKHPYQVLFQIGFGVILAEKNNFQKEFVFLAYHLSQYFAERLKLLRLLMSFKEKDLAQ